MSAQQGPIRAPGAWRDAAPTSGSAQPEASVRLGTAVTVSVEEAAMLLGIGRTVAYRLVLGGDLRSVKIGRRRLVVRSSIEQYVERLEASTS